MDTLGKRLKSLRAADGRTQDEISSELKNYDVKADRGTVARWENDIQQPTLKPVKALADIYGVSSDYIIDGSSSGVVSETAKYKIPVYGRIMPGFVSGNRRGIIGWEICEPDNQYSHEDRFGFIVNGDSMYPKYMDGDIIIARYSALDEIPNSGRDVIITIGKNDAILRRLSLSEDGVILLQAYNQSYPALSFTRDEVENTPVKIRGYATELRRRLM
ncbi:MAG: LexA family transcriptional regulator [Eubacteriales bacterium]|nr:LexA family transcriptional regulator [Eubacteriales bacterium]MDD4327411.1 LexA family transcriptional regulator [Eubacteriales bacterium]MDD4717703.1 LexA family transcriptional regulator [Eubacteriales bacterium]NCU26125.1 LexA family transcriptional regulator [Candidatus Nomurabacteria bacterium]